MGQVKLSVSLSPSEVAVLDKYAQSAGLKSRSAAMVTERKTGEQAVAARDALLQHLRSEAASDAATAAVTVADGAK